LSHYLLGSFFAIKALVKIGVKRKGDPALARGLA